MCAFASGPNYNFHSRNGYYEIAGGNIPSTFPSLHFAAAQITSALSCIAALEGRNVSTAPPAAVHPSFPILKLLVQAESLRCSPTPSIFSNLLQPLYTSALRVIATSHPNNVDASFFLVSSPMVLNPWKLYSYPAHEELSPHVAEIRDVLTAARKLDPEHFGLAHLMVHFAEMGPSPSEALSKWLAAGSTLEQQFCSSLPGVSSLSHTHTHHTQDITII